MEPNKPKKQKPLINLDDIHLGESMSVDTPGEERKEIFKLIYQLKIKQHPELKQRLKAALKQRDSPVQLLLEEFRTLMEFFKEYQTMTPIIQLFYSAYKEQITAKCSNAELLWNYWKCVPLTHLEDFINSFKLQQVITKVDPNEFYSLIRQLLLKSKNKEAALYCHLFNIHDEEFLLKQVLPRLLQGQDLYTNYVTNLFKHYPVLLNAIVQQIDPVAGIKIVQTSGGNVAQYPKLVKHMQHSAFQHNIHEFKDWFKCQEIMSFCPLFLQWYADQLEDPMKTSMLVRNGLLEGEETIRNPLFQKDDFTYTEEIIGKHKGKHHWKLADLEIQQKDVFFVSAEQSMEFEMMQKTLLGSSIVGFDSEFKAISHKYESDGVSIIQLSADKKIFILDFLKLGTSEKTINFLRKLFEAKDIVKVGHSLKCDFLYLSKTINIQHDCLNSFIDVADLFKIKYPQESQSSLSYMVLAMTGTPLSKYDQRSNWNKRPLRRAQIHYAALDAYICQVIYQKLNEEVELSSLQLQKSEKVASTLLVSNGWLSYGPECAHFMKKPKFIVDNMLKRLSTYLRNLGLDAEYLAVRDFSVAISIAANEQRIIITKDKHLKYKKNVRVPVYLIQSHESENMTKEVVSAFGIKLEEYELLSRCVKCNNSQLVVVDRQQALAKLNFKYKDVQIKEFFSCNKCEQFYWEGHSYNNSRKRFSNFL